MKTNNTTTDLKTTSKDSKNNKANNLLTNQSRYSSEDKRERRDGPGGN